MTDKIASKIDAIESPIVWNTNPFVKEAFDTDFSLGVKSRTKTVSEIQELYRDYIKSHKGMIVDAESSIEENACFIDQLIHAGKTEQIYDFCNSFDDDTLRQILNATPYQMYHGNVLHSTLYSNTGNIAKELYIFFRDRGALPCRDYYGTYPWEQGGILWTCIPEKNYERNVAEFSEIYHWAESYEQSIEYVKAQKKVIYASVPCYCNYHRGLDSDYESDYSYAVDSEYGSD